MIPNVMNYPSLFLSPEELKKSCDAINRQVGTRAQRYKEILDSFIPTIRSVSKIKDIMKFRDHFLVFEESIAADVKKRVKIVSSLLDVRQEIDKIFSNKIDACLSIIQKNLKKSYNATELDANDRVVEYLEEIMPENLLTQFKEAIKKCHSLYHERVRLALFAEDHGIFTEESDNRNKNNVFPVLSIDGGGIRGIIPATVLVEIEHITKKPIASLFQLVGGTSTGGILALGLTRQAERHPYPKYQAEDLLKMYLEEADQIFKKNPAYSDEIPDGLSLIEKLNYRLENCRYRSPANYFSKKIGSDTYLGSLMTNVVIVTNDCAAVSDKSFQVGISAASLSFAFLSSLAGDAHSTYLASDAMNKKIHYFTKRGLKRLSYSLTKVENSFTFRKSISYSQPYSLTYEMKGNYLASFVAQATSAAPTFFPCVQHLGQKFVDGGILQNNPALPCIFEAFDLGVKREDVFMVSLGTGDTLNFQTSTDAGSSIFSAWSHVTQPDYQTEKVLRAILGNGYHRLQYHFENNAPSLDAKDPQTLALLKEKGDELVEENEEKLRFISKILSPDAI